MTELIGYRLSGESRAVAAFLDRILVQCDVVGVQEEPVEVWVRGGLASSLEREVRADVPAGITVERLPDPGQEWTGLERDTRIQVLPDLVVRPPWVEPPGEAFEGVELVVPRGSAFGSGESESTQAVLTLLHRHWTGFDGGEPSSFADVGTGSGILCLYAAMRGVPDIHGCDLDPAAVVAARELVPDGVFAVGGPEVLVPASCVVANLRCDEWLESRASILPLWRERLIVGGLHPDEEEGALAGLPAPAAVARVGEFAAFAFDQSEAPPGAR